MKRKIYFNVNYESKFVTQIGQFLHDLVSRGYDVFVDERARNLSCDELASALEGCYALIVDSSRINGELLNLCTNLRIVSRTGVGYDTVDVVACTAHGVAVTIVPGVGAKAVAEHALALMLSVARRITEMDKSVRKGEWKRFIGPALYGKNLGIIGFGSIGKQLAKITSGFCMKVLVHDPLFLNKTPIDNVRVCTLEELLSESDFISIHCPLTTETFHLITMSQLRQMKKSAILINAARGGVVDDTDLYIALREKMIYGAGIDVFEIEPPEINSPLFCLDEVVVSAHNAGSSIEGKNDIVYAAIQNILSLDAGEKPIGLLNPEVTENPIWANR